VNGSRDAEVAGQAGLGLQQRDDLAERGEQDLHILRPALRSSHGTERRLANER
jgi:hypothetical protein